MKKYCGFCDNEAIAIIDRSDCPICYSCMEVYECGQENPEGGITYLDDLPEKDTNLTTSVK
jgi:hypothetical protein